MALRSAVLEPHSPSGRVHGKPNRSRMVWHNYSLVKTDVLSLRPPHPGKARPKQPAPGPCAGPGNRLDGGAPLPPYGCGGCMIP